MESEVLECNADKANDTSSESFLFLDVLITLVRRKRFIGVFTLSAAILTAIIVFLLPNKYTATTVLLPPQQNSSMSSTLMSQLSGSGGLASLAGTSLGLKNPNEMFVSLFRSRTVEEAMIRKYSLMARYRSRKLSDGLKNFESATTVELGAKDGMLRISATDRDPNEAATLANGYVEQYKLLSANLAITEASQRRAFFEQQLLEAKSNLAKAEDALKHTEQTTGVLQIDSQARSLIESAATLRAQVVAKEVQLQGMRSYAANNNPDVALAEQQLAALRSQLSILAGSDQDLGKDVVVPKGKVPEAGLEYLRRVRDVKYFETISELIAKQFEIAKLDEARQGATVQIVDLAVPPDRKSSPHRSLIVLAVTFVALLSVSFWVVARTSWKDFKQRPEIANKLRALQSEKNHTHA